MNGHGTAYQRGAFIVTSLLTGLVTTHFIRRRTIVLAGLLAAMFIVASTLTWQSKSSDHDATLIAVWCLMNGAVAGVLRTAVCSIYSVLFGRDRLDSALLLANLWDSVGATLAVLTSDWLCLVIRAWIVVFTAGLAAVVYACLECNYNGALTSNIDNRSSGGGGGSVVVSRREDSESLASVSLSPYETGDSSSTTSSRSNRFSTAVLNLAANRAYYRPT